MADEDDMDALAKVTTGMTAEKIQLRDRFAPAGGSGAVAAVRLSAARGRLTVH
jgi:hypothetical protein